MKTCVCVCVCVCVACMAERYDAKSNVKLGGFQSQLEVSYMSSYTEEL